MAHSIIGSNDGLISGDTIAIGNNNTNTVTVNHHHGGRGGNDKKGGDGNKSGGSGGGEEALGMGAFAIIALMAMAFYFARHADLIYALLTILGLIVAILPALSMILQLTYRVESEHPVKEVSTFAIGVLVTTLALFGYTSYPLQLTQIAQHADGMRVFWCGLSSYGHTVAAQSVVTALGLAAAGLLGLPSALASFFKYFASPVAWHQAILGRISSNGVLGAAFLFGTATCAFALFGSHFMQQFVDSASSLLCPHP